MSGPMTFSESGFGKPPNELRVLAAPHWSTITASPSEAAVVVLTAATE